MTFSWDLNYTHDFTGYKARTKQFPSVGKWIRESFSSSRCCPPLFNKS